MPREQTPVDKHDLAAVIKGCAGALVVGKVSKLAVSMFASKKYAEFAETIMGVGTGLFACQWQDLPIWPFEHSNRE